MVTIKLGSPIEEPRERNPVGVEMWYDPHYRHWVLYPVDAEGTQLAEARYGFGKAEAKRIKQVIEQDIRDGKRDGYYY